MRFSHLPDLSERGEGKRARVGCVHARGGSLILSPGGGIGFAQILCRRRGVGKVGGGELYIARAPAVGIAEGDGREAFASIERSVADRCNADSD